MTDRVESVALLYGCDAFAELASIFKVNPRPAGVFRQTRPAGGGALNAPPPCLSPEVTGGAGWGRRRSKALSKTILSNTENFLKKVTCQVKVRSKA